MSLVVEWNCRFALKYDQEFGCTCVLETLCRELELLPLFHASHVEVYREILESSSELSMNTPILPSGVIEVETRVVCNFEGSISYLI